MLDPLFNTLHAAARGPGARATCSSWPRSAGVDVGEVYEVDASRRTTAVNAYVTGLGRTKRVVLYDTLLEDFTRDEVRLVVAHELAHVHYRDVPRGLLYLALVAPVRAARDRAPDRRLAPRRRVAGPAMLPGARAGVGVVGDGDRDDRQPAVAGAIEARADSFALQHDRRAEAVHLASRRRIALRNLADPDPPRAAARSLLATHPPTIERIGIGVALRGRQPLSRGPASASRGLGLLLAPPNSGRFLMPSRVCHFE